MTKDKTIDTILNICRSFVKTEELEEQTLEYLADDQENEVIEYATGHKLISICYQVLSLDKTLIQSQIYARLAVRSRNIILRSMAMFREMKVIQDAFNEQGIEVRPYKGVVFAQHFYKSLSLRNSVDIDFAIRLEDLTRSHSIMTQLEYEEIKGTLDKTNVKKSRAYYLDYPWRKVSDRGFKIIMEFHLSPAHKALYVPCDFSQYLCPRQKERDELHSDFSLTEHALFILIHHGAVDNWGTLMHLIDLHQILTVLDTSQLDDFIALAEQARVRKFLDLGITLCERLLETSYEVEKKYKISQALVDRIQEDCLQGRLAGKWSENRDKLKYHLAFRDSRMDQLKTIRSLARFGIYKKLGL